MQAQIPRGSCASRVKEESDFHGCGSGGASIRTAVQGQATKIIQDLPSTLKPSLFSKK